MMNKSNIFGELTKVILGIIVLFPLQSCTDQNESDKEIISSNSEVETEVRKQIEKAYNYYDKSDIKWVDFYNDTFKVISENGSILENYADSLRKQWRNIYKHYNVIVKYHGEPTVIGSGNQALHYNNASEIFVDKKTNDTLSNSSGGLWIALWQKQNDDSWKIILETYQAE